MKRQSSRLAKSNAEKVKSETERRREEAGHRGEAVVTVDPFFSKSEKMSEYHKAGDDEIHNGGVRCDAESALETVNDEEMMNSSPEGSSDERVDDDSEDSDGEDGNFVPVTRNKTSQSLAKQSRKKTNASQKKPSPKLSRAQKNPPPKPVKPREVSTVSTTPTNKGVIQDFFFRFKCQWQAHNSNHPSQVIMCFRTFSSLDLSINHLQGHHLKKMRENDGPYKCWWKDCALKDKDFEAIEELEKHLVLHAEEKLVKITLDTEGGVVKPVQRVPPTVAITACSMALNNKATVENNTAQVAKPNTPRNKKYQGDAKERGHRTKSTRDSSDMDDNKSLNVRNQPESSLNIRPNASELKTERKVRKRGRSLSQSSSASPKKKSAKPSDQVASDLNTNSVLEDKMSEFTVPASTSPPRMNPEVGIARGFENFAHRQLLTERGESCINSVLQALLTTSLLTIVKRLCPSAHRCYFCRMLSFTQRMIHNAEAKPIKPFELSLYKDEMGITDIEGEPTKYINDLINEIIADEKLQHKSNDTKYKFMIRFQKKTCSCSMSYESYCWALSPTKKNEFLTDLMVKYKVHCDECKVATSVQSIQMPDNLVITLKKDNKTPDASVFYPDEWVSHNTRYFLAAVIVDAPSSDAESESRYYTYCKVFGKWMCYNSNETTKASSCGALGNKQARVLVYVGNELTPQVLEYALVQAKSYSVARHADVRVKSEPLDTW